MVATAEHRGLFRLLTEGPRTREEIIAAGIFGPRAYDAIVNALICEGFLVKLDEKLHFTGAIIGRGFFIII